MPFPEQLSNGGDELVLDTKFLYVSFEGERAARVGDSGEAKMVIYATADGRTVSTQSKGSKKGIYCELGPSITGCGLREIFGQERRQATHR